MTRKALRIIVSGRVQGVGFRAFLAHAAARLELSGFARNRGLDEVETLVAGGATALEDFARLARRGPPGARVDTYREEEALAEEAGGAGFVVAPSV
ncbi:MAG TPA: acylphosphatase [Methylocystis sp.]|nr:acylphosphatase [Methylocystis sp.]